MANYDVIVTAAKNYSPILLNEQEALATLALGIYQLENNTNVSTNATTVKAHLQTAQTNLSGIPTEKLLGVLVAFVWAAVDSAGAADLANSTITTKTQSVAYSYLVNLDRDALLRFILWEFGLAQAAVS